MTEQDNRRTASWAKPDLPDLPVPARMRLGWWLERGRWLDLGIALVLSACWDLAALFVAGGVDHVARCAGSCSDAQQAVVYHDERLLIPLLLAVPVLVALLARRARWLVVAVQVPLCLALWLSVG